MCVCVLALSIILQMYQTKKKTDVPLMTFNLKWESNRWKYAQRHPSRYDTHHNSIYLKKKRNEYTNEIKQ